MTYSPNRSHILIEEVLLRICSYARYPLAWLGWRLTDCRKTSPQPLFLANQNSFHHGGSIWVWRLWNHSTGPWRIPLGNPTHGDWAFGIRKIGVWKPTKPWFVWSEFVHDSKLWEDSHGRSETAPLFLSEVNFSTSHRWFFGLKRMALKHATFSSLRDDVGMFCEDWNYTPSTNGVNRVCAASVATPRVSPRCKLPSNGNSGWITGFLGRSDSGFVQDADHATSSFQHIHFLTRPGWSGALKSGSTGRARAINRRGIEPCARTLLKVH